MSLTLTPDGPVVERVSRNLGMYTGRIAFDSNYPTGGELLTEVSQYFTSGNMFSVHFDPQDGYLFSYDKTNNKVIVYLASGTPAITVANEGAHTHGVALDSGASAAPDGTNVVVDGQSRNPSLYVKLDNPVDLSTTLTEQAWTILAINDFVVIPSGTDAVLLRMGLLDDTAGSYLAVRDPDIGSGRGEIGWCIAQVAGIANWVDIVQSVPKTGANGQKLELAINDATGGTISDTAHVSILGYWRRVINLPNEDHTHASGTLADTASGVGSNHNHTATSTAEAADEVGSGTNLAALTGVRFTAFGLI